MSDLHLTGGSGNSLLLRRRMMMQGMGEDKIWKVYMYSPTQGYTLVKGATAVSHDEREGRVIRRSIIFPCPPNTTVTVSKTLVTTMRMGFLPSRTATIMRRGAQEKVNATSITDTSTADAQYCVCQLCVNSNIKGDGTSSSGQYTWEQIIQGLTITIG